MGTEREWLDKKDARFVTVVSLVAVVLLALALVAPLFGAQTAGWPVASQLTEGDPAVVTPGIVDKTDLGFRTADLDPADVVGFYEQVADVNMQVWIRTTGNGDINEGWSTKVRDAGEITLITSSKETIVFYAKANPGYRILLVEVDNAKQDEGYLDDSLMEYQQKIDGGQRLIVVTFERTYKTYEVIVGASGYGTVYYGSNEASGLYTVSQGDDFTITIKPYQDFSISPIAYDIGQVTLDNDLVNDYTSVDDKKGTTYTYTIPNVSENHSIMIYFVEIETAPGLEADSFKFDMSNQLAGSPYETTTARVYNLAKDGASVTFNPTNPPYDRIRLWINDEWHYASSDLRFDYSVLIEKVQVYDSGLYGQNWKSVNLEGKFTQIIIDKTAPAIGLPDMEWTNQDYTVYGRMTDAAPSSGFSRVVWSYSQLNETQVLAEPTNVQETPDGTFSITVPLSTGNRTLYIYAIDSAGNVSAARQYVLRFDTVSPAITGFQFRKTASSSNTGRINFTNTGTKFTEDIEVVISATDALSGVQSITIYSDGNPVETQPVVGGSATFTLHMRDFSNNVLSAVATDNAGNDSNAVRPANNNSNARSDRVSLVYDTPSITITPTIDYKYRVGTQEWYNQDVNLTVTTRTTSTTLETIAITVNNTPITTDINGLPIDISFEPDQVKVLEFLISTEQISLQGLNTIEVTVTNSHGSSETMTSTLYIDTVNPDIDNFTFTKQNGDSFDPAFNFLPFGNFFNEQVKVTVTANERGTDTSGVEIITLYADGLPMADMTKPANDNGNGTYSAVFTLPAYFAADTNLLDIDLSATATDHVGNITGMDSANPNGVPVALSSANSAYQSGHILIETIKPTIQIATDEPVYTDSESRVWYTNTASIEVRATDAESGIRSVKIKINGEEIQLDAEGNPIDTAFYLNETHELSFLINIEQGQRAADGSYLLEVLVTDNAGNEQSASELVYTDIDAPTITGISFQPESADGISETDEFIDYLEYGFYFQKEFTALIHVNDIEPSSGLNQVNYRLVWYEEGEPSEVIVGSEAIVNGVATLTIPQGFKGQIYVEATDNIGNISDEVTPQGFVVDDASPVISIINTGRTDNRDADGNLLYTAAVSFDVIVSDTDSGLREIGYYRSVEGTPTDRQSITIDNSGYAEGDELDDGWVILEMDHNLVISVSRTFTLSSDANGIMLIFDATDRSGNVESDIRSDTITIDTTPPIINVVFRSDEAKNGYYYNSNRVAEITIIERNFDSSLIDIAITNSYGAVPSASFGQASGGGYATIIEFDEGDFTFDINGKDLAGHSATVNFSGGNERMFVVDKTRPVVEENFDSLIKPETDDSFNSEKTVTIRVIDHNFSPELANLVIREKDAGLTHNTSGLADNTYGSVSGLDWVSVGDTHTLSFTLQRDAVYQIEISPVDLAENVGESRSSVVFEIDLTAPVIIARDGVPVKENDTEFVDAYPYARKDDPAPTIEFFDANLDYIQYSLIVYIPRNVDSRKAVSIAPVKAYLPEDVNNSGRIKGSIFTLPDFAEDGIYALELTAVDVAGNKSLLNQSTYSRMIGSDVLAYILESDLDQMTGLYSIQYENGDAISKRPDDFIDLKILVFAEYGSDVDIVLRDSNADIIDTNLQAVVDEDIFGVGIYNFVLKADFFKDNFQDDTDAELILSVLNEGRRIDLGKVHIDNIAPTFDLPAEFESWHWYYGSADRVITVTSISELLDLTQCKVYDNGVEIEFDYSSVDNTLTFTLSEGWHNVGVIVYDLAGNASNMQERANIHVGLFWQWVIAVPSFLLIVAVIALAVRNAKKKRSTLALEEE